MLIYLNLEAAENEIVQHHSEQIDGNFTLVVDTTHAL